MARYTVGEELFVVHIEVKNLSVVLRASQFWTTPHLSVPDEIGKISIMKLKVMEHHRVRDNTTPDNAEPTCDGFVLVDEQGNTWHNQYPLARYGQTTDVADRMFTRVFSGPVADLPPSLVVQTRLLSDFMDVLNNGINLPDMPNTRQLVPFWHSLFHAIKSKLKNDFNKILVEEVIWDDCPDIKHFVVKDDAPQPVPA
jgi:hypothetical protein